MCGNILKLGGQGAHSPRKILKFTTSEIPYKAKKDCFFFFDKNYKYYYGS